MIHQETTLEGLSACIQSYFISRKVRAYDPPRSSVQNRWNAFEGA